MLIYLIKILKYILTEPSNKDQRLLRCFYFFLWQGYKRIVKKPIVLSLDNARRYLAYPDSQGASFPIYTALYDSVYISFVRDFVSDDNCMIDVGANIGLYTLLLSHKFKGGYIFEPEDISYGLLLENLFLNDLMGNFFAEKKALGSCTGLASLQINETAGLANKIVTGDSNSVSENIIKVPVTTLDEFIPDNRKPYIEYIKIDVEGFEIEVLKGGSSLVEDYNVKLIQFERLSSTPLEPLLEYFDRIGWLVFSLDKKRKISFDKEEICCHHDLFAIPSSEKVHLESVCKND